MKKILSYFLPLLVAFFALIPPIDFRVPAPTGYWPLLMAIVGFLGIRTLFIKAPLLARGIPLLAFISCFLSSIPYISFNAYVSIVACYYFYLALLRMDLWQPMFQTIKTLLVLNGILLVMQIVGSDQLMNFGLDQISCYGVVGHHMQMGSFSIVLTALLINISPLFLIFPLIVALICNSSWTFLCAGIGLLICYKPPSCLLVNRHQEDRRRFLFSKKIVISICSFILVGLFVYFAFKTNKFHANIAPNGRWAVWLRSIEMLNEKPWTGWGPGVYKGAFPALSGIASIPWKTAHNDLIQYAFELGYPIACYFLFCWIYLFIRLIKYFRICGSPYLLAGFVMISLDSLVHFPSRMIQCVPLIITFLAYCQKRTK